MATKKTSKGSRSIFTEAKKLRAKYPRKYKLWTDYVAWASRIYAQQHHGKSPVGKKSRRGKKRSVGKTLVPVKGIVHAKAVGSVSYHKHQAKKQLEEQLAWLLLARDQEQRKGERNKLTKKVRLKRIELNRLK